jgi:hypothetical protein
MHAEGVYSNGERDNETAAVCKVAVSQYFIIVLFVLFNS